MSRKSRNRKRYVCCPACGEVVFKGTVAESEHICHKCGATIGAWVKDGVVVVYDPIDESREESTAHRLSTYLDALARDKDKV